jgi:hypothetical protein
MYGRWWHSLYRSFHFMEPRFTYVWQPTSYSCVLTWASIWLQPFSNGILGARDAPQPALNKLILHVHRAILARLIVILIFGLPMMDCRSDSGFVPMYMVPNNAIYNVLCIKDPTYRNSATHEIFG